jgi:insulin receptor substrate 1
MPMSPATGIHSHSRASSLVEENSTLTDGYVPMAPVGDDGYVDMDPANNHNGHFPDDMSQHGGSSCSVTSGTPSTDLRFSEYHLDKVTSFLAPGEDLQARPTRAYSVGSRPEPTRHRKNRLDVAQQEASRVRAFSVGSRSKRPEIGRLANIVTAPLVSGMESSHSNKSSSAPLLSSSWGHNSGCSVTSDRMEDLMELDFTRPNAPGVLSSPPSSYSQPQSFSTAIDTSSYVDMSPGQPPISTTAPYVDMNGPVKNRNNNNSNNNNNINNNNNNNITTANHNHNHNHSMVMVSTHKPVITQVSSLLKSVDESSYMRMNRPLDDWSQPRISPKQVPSPCQEEYMEMNGPPGGTRTAPMDLPQPRRPPEGYVEMSFKAKPSLEQDYINMSMGLGRNYRRHHSSSNRKKKCSMPIAIQAGSKSSKTPNFLPLNGSPSSESLASTPASPPRATPTGSSATIFPFSLNSPQSPIKPFTASQANEKSSSIATASFVKTEMVNAPSITRKMSAPSPLPGVDGCPSSKKAHDNPINSKTSNFVAMYKHSHSVSKEQDMEVEIECKMEVEKEKKKGKSQEKEKEQEKKEREKEKGREKQKLKEKEREEEKDCSRVACNSSSSQKPTVTSLSPITKKLSDLSVSKPRLVTASPMVSPTPTGFKPVQIPKPASPKVGDDATPTPTPIPTPTSTPTPTPSPLDSEGYEKLQPGDPAIHYASLDLPEVAPPPPQSPVAEKDGFTYAEIDFAKLK